jgi:hypothetical protein
MTAVPVEESSFPDMAFSAGQGPLSLLLVAIEAHVMVGVLQVRDRLVFHIQEMAVGAFLPGNGVAQ